MSTVCKDITLGVDIWCAGINIFGHTMYVLPAELKQGCYDGILSGHYNLAVFVLLKR